MAATVLQYYSTTTMTSSNKPTYNPATERVLVNGLNAMTKACDSLSKQNDILNIDIQKLRKKVERLQEKVLNHPEHHINE